VNSELIHQHEGQRQFVRVKLPATIQFPRAGERLQFRLKDISVGGFSFDGGDQRFVPGEALAGHVVVPIDAVAFSIPVRFTVRLVDPDAARVACVFERMGANDSTALHQIITAFLGGELTTAGDMLATLSRDNFIKARGRRAGGGPSRASKTRAMLGGLMVLAAAAVACGIAAISS